MMVGIAVFAAGSIVQLAAWIGSVVNTYRLQDKTWLIILLAGGVLGLGFAVVGFAAMMAYLIAGPDGMTIQSSQQSAPAPQSPALAQMS
jgi:hypothetical protein